MRKVVAARPFLFLKASNKLNCTSLPLDISCFSVLTLALEKGLLSYQVLLSEQMTTGV